MGSYAEKLRDVRWQKRRLEICASAHWTCAICGSTTKTLTVHHVVYVRGRNPWEYRDELLQCMCEPCHFEREEIFRKITDAAKIALMDFPTSRLVLVSKRLFTEAMEAL